MSAREAGLRWAPWWVPAFAVILFVRVLGHPFVYTDDWQYIVANPMVQSPASVPWHVWLTTHHLGYPMPLPMAAYAALWAAFGSAPAAFHLLSVLLHGANVAALMWAMRQWGAGRAARTLAALVFVCHPVTVEPVAWASGVKDLACALGVLLALGGAARGGRGVSMVMALGFLLAFASKPTVVAVPFALALALWRGGPVGGPATVWRQCLPWCALAVVELGWLLYAPTTMGTTIDVPDPALRVLTAAGALTRNVLQPTDPSIAYPRSAFGLGHAALGFVVLAGWVAGTLRAWLLRRPTAAWLACALAAYLPVSNLAPLTRFVTDSYAYLPLALLLGAAAVAWGRGRGVPRKTERLALAALGVTASSLALLTWVHLGVWRSTSALWGDAHANYPDDGEIIYYYGSALGLEGQESGEFDLYFANWDALLASRRIPGPLVRYLVQERRYAEAAALCEQGARSGTEQEPIVDYWWVEMLLAKPDYLDIDAVPADRVERALEVHLTQRRTPLSDEQQRNLVRLRESLERAAGPK